MTVARYQPTIKNLSPSFFYFILRRGGGGEGDGRGGCTQAGVNMTLSW